MKTILSFAKNVLLLIALAISFCAKSQEFLISTADNKIYSVSQDLTTTLLYDVGFFDQSSILDIAAKDANTIYAITGSGSLIEIDIVNQSFSILNTYPNTQVNALYYSADDELYAINNNGGTFNRINPVNGDIIEIQEFQQFTPGDLTSYDGNIIFAGADLDLYKYDQASDPVKIGCTELTIWGLANFVNGCGDQTVWAFDPGANVFEYDVEGNQLTFLGSLNDQVMSSINGAASINELEGENCPFQEIPEVNCVLSTNELTNRGGLNVYPNPSSGEVQLELPFPPEEARVVVYNLQGQLVKEAVATNRLELYELPSGVYALQITRESTGDFWNSKLVLSTE
ncbi:MAG: T9SS type A sorting domain-containing protein [Bacteroidota bacterium]